MTSTFDITFNGETSYNKGLYVVRRPDISAPEPVYEPYEIPGHDGILMPVDVRYGALEIDVELNFMSSSPTTWGDAYRVAKEWLQGEGELSFSDDYRMFYNVYIASIVDAERVSRRIGSFTARFVCEPYTYARSGQPTVAIPTSYKDFDNPFTETARPLFYISTSGEDVGTTRITISGTPEKQFFVSTVEGYNSYSIDTEKGVVLASSLSLLNPGPPVIWNTHSSGNFEDFYLPPGTTRLKASGWASEEGQEYSGQASISPRWRTL